MRLDNIEVSRAQRIPEGIPSHGDVPASLAAILPQVRVAVDICDVPEYFLEDMAAHSVGSTAYPHHDEHELVNRPFSLRDFEDPETELERAWLSSTVEALNVARDNYLLAKGDGDAA